MYDYGRMAIAPTLALLTLYVSDIPPIPFAVFYDPT